MQKITRKGSPGLAWVLALVTAMVFVNPAVPASAQEKAVMPEKNPPGDIPDNQVFITYTSPLGFSLRVPEGWSRKDDTNGVSFADKYGRIEVTVSETATPPTAATVQTREAAALEKTGRAVKINSIKDVKVLAGPAVKLVYTSNSEPNPITAKQARLENERYLIAGAGKLATLTFSAPAGADNADQWKLMGDSFHWK